MTDQEKAQAIERANSYRMMLDSWAWKDLWARIEEEKSGKLEALMTQEGSDDLDFTRGFVKAINWIKDEISFVTSVVQ